MWTLVDNPTTAAAFRQVLADCADYVPYLDKVMTNIEREDTTAWYWDNGTFQLALAYVLSSDSKYVTIIVGVPSPEGEQLQWCTTMVRKLRQELDPLGVEEWYADQLDEYEAEHMEDFADGIDRVCHEFAGDTRRSGKRRIRFDRKNVDKTKDEEMRGPGKDRPARRRRN